MNFKFDSFFGILRRGNKVGLGFEFYVICCGVIEQQTAYKL